MMQTAQFSKTSNGDNDNLRPIDSHTPAHAQEAFEQLKPLLEALDPEKYKQRPRVSVLDAVGNAIKLARVATRDREQFVSYFNGFDISYLDNLKTIALALWGAELDWRMASGDDREALDDALESATDWRRKLLKAFAWAFSGDQRVEKVLAEIRRGHGHTDLADDLAMLYKLGHENIAIVEAKTDLSAEVIERVGIISEKLMGLVNDISKPEKLKRRILRDKAFSYLFEAYSEVSLHGRLLFRHQNPNERYFGIYSGRKRPRPRAERVPEPERTPMSPDLLNTPVV